MRPQKKMYIVRDNKSIAQRPMRPSDIHNFIRCRIKNMTFDSAINFLDNIENTTREVRELVRRREFNGS